MKNIALLLFFAALLAGCAKTPRSQAGYQPTVPAELEDRYLWLEDVTGERPIEWVREQNAKTSAEFESTEDFKNLEADLLRIMDSRERIPMISKAGPFYYNCWKDDNNPRGLWRRTTLEEYRKNDPEWDVILDVDALGKAEGVNWVWHGARILKPECRLALISLSPGGSDADVVREFDIQKREFVVDGFRIPEAKGEMSWIDEDTVYVATDFGPGTLTDSGYPRIVKLWKRGTPLEKAETVFEGKKEDMSVGAYYDDTKGFERHIVYRRTSFYSGDYFLRGKDGVLQKIEIPEDAEPSAHRDWILVSLRTPWTAGGRTYREGALLAERFDRFMAGERDFEVLFEPTPTTSLASFDWTMNHLVINVLEDVKNRLWLLTPREGKWTREAMPGGPGFATVSLWAVDEQESDDYFMTMTDYLTPSSLFHGSIGGEPEKLKQTPSFFDASGLEISQHFAVSKDGTRIPYFQVSPKNMTLDGSNVTLLNGYGGFEVSRIPYYSGGMGRGWLSKGGVFVVANIRGGGEYGPKWHQAALKENRNRCFEDFAAVAKDLIARKVTSPEFLGVEGGSNGGLLVGNMLTQYPELFGAVVCQVPLLDMKRYSKLLAGASWMAEYGDPDKPGDWEYIKAFSPYHNVRKDDNYPPVIFMTSTRDDRVHPGHARKMAAKMLDMGHDVRYFENIEGGHGGAADNKQAAHMWALCYTFLWQNLGKK